MEVKFFKYYKGKRYYQVFREEDRELFTGTAPECRRFMKVRREKVKRFMNRSYRRRGKDCYSLARALCLG